MKRRDEKRGIEKREREIDRERGRERESHLRSSHILLLASLGMLSYCTVV